MRACWLLLCVLGGIAKADLEVSSDGAVIDGKHFACGQEVTVVGVYADDTGHPKQKGGFRSAMRIKAASIDARATRQAIDFHLFFRDLQGNAAHRQTLKAGAFYTVKGVLRDGVEDGDTAHFYLEVESLGECPPFYPRLSDFAGRQITHEGEAALLQNRPAIRAQNEWLRTDLAKWPEEVLGKKVSAKGIVAVNAQGVMLTETKWELSDLRDRVGQDVELRGYYWKVNLDDRWRFRYRDTDLYVDGPQPQPDWANRVMVVRGRLERQIRSSPAPGAAGDALAECFVVRAAQSKFADAPGDQKAAPRFHMAQRFTGGVPDLLFQLPARSEWMNSDSAVSLLAEVNEEALRVLLRSPNDSTRRALLRKMNETDQPEELRLLYAGVLAELGEPAGSEWVLQAAKGRGARLADALWLMGGGLQPDRDPATPGPDWTWADAFLMEAINDESKLGTKFRGIDGPLTMREAAFHFGRPEIELANSGQARAVDALTALVNKDFEPWRICEALATAHPALPPAPLIRLIKQIPDKKRNNLNRVLETLLKQGDSDGAWWFIPNLDDFKVFEAFLEYADRDAVALIEVRLPELKGAAQIHAQELIMDRAKDSAGQLLQQIADPQALDRGTVLWLLGRHPDPRIPAALAKMLRTCSPRDLGEEEFTRQSAAEQTLQAMAKCGEPAIDELIGLLDADLGRFGSTMDSAAFHREIAGRLSEITHEGFGVDQAAWREWREQARKQ